MSQGAGFGNRWWIVFGATLSMLVAQGPVILYTVGLFIKPLNQEFGWDRASISAAGGVAAISSAISIPFVGSIMGRWGARALLLPIVVLCASSVALIALTPKSVVVFMLFFAITGVLGSGQGPLGYAKCVSAWFDDRRGLALGITMSGIGLGAALVPQYTQFLIGNLGWRVAYLGLGLLTLVVAFPAVFLFICEPIKAKTTAGGVHAQSPASEDRPPDLEVREALGGRRFWLIACALLLVSTVTQGLVVHTVPLLTDNGYSPEAAATLMIAVGLSTMAGRLLSGYLVDKIFAPFVAASFFLLPCLRIYLLASTISPLAAASLREPRRHALPRFETGYANTETVCHRVVKRRKHNHPSGGNLMQEKSRTRCILQSSSARVRFRVPQGCATCPKPSRNLLETLSRKPSPHAASCSS